MTEGIADARVNTGSDVSCAARRGQTIADVIVSVVIAMLVWPFPIARATLDPAAHFAGVLATCVLVQVVYFAATAALWRQTLGMRLIGARLETLDGGTPRRVSAVRWGVVSALLAPWHMLAPRSACKAAAAERMSGARLSRLG